MRGGGFVLDGLLRGLAAEGVEDGGRDAEAEQGGGDEAADDDDGDGMEDFLARLVGGEDERDEADAGGERGHEHGHEPFLGAADDHRLGEALRPRAA